MIPTRRPGLHNVAKPLENGPTRREGGLEKETAILELRLYGESDPAAGHNGLPPFSDTGSGGLDQGRKGYPSLHPYHTGDQSPAVIKWLRFLADIDFVST